MEEKEVVSKNFIELAIDKDLAEGVYDHVCTRFPPEPNGYLHIGHAKSILLNYGLSQEYNGEFHMRFDDTNPTKEKTEFVDSIKADIQWLGADLKDHLYYASDYFPQMYEAAVKLIKKGKAFVCDLSAEEIREYRGTLTEPGKESPYRNRSVEENLDLFERMKNGEFEDGSKVLRAKIDMASPNINMRDPVIYRVAHMHHHRTGDTWCIYPMYDFAHPIEDAIEGITHSICTLEFEDHRPLYDWVIENVTLPSKPRQIEFARLGINNTVMSKRKLRKLVEEGIVSGGGVAYVNAVPAVEALVNDVEGDEKTGVRIIAAALTSPIRQIAANAGLDGSVILEKVRNSGKNGYGFDAYKEEYCDMIPAGIVDPTKVTRSALENAASVSAMVLTTESLVADKPEPPAPAAPAGGEMGGMY